MTIHIEALCFNVIIGLLDFEREKPQRVLIDVTATYDYHDNSYIDYAHIVMLIKDTLKEKRYKLLENALEGLKKTLTLAYPNIKTLSLKISKPDILEDCSVGISHTWKI